MSDKHVDDLQDQLKQISFRIDGVAAEYPDLSPDSRQESKEYIEKTIKTLRKVQKELEEADPDSKIVQVVGLKSKNATVEDFKESFNVAAKPTFGGSGPFPKSMPDIKSFKKEINYRLDENHILQPAASEWFLEFHKASDAKHALTLPHFNLQVKELNGIAGFRVQFGKPSQSFATRATFRQIGDPSSGSRRLRRSTRTLALIVDMAT